MADWGNTVQLGGHVAGFGLTYITQRITIPVDATVNTLSVLTFAGASGDEVLMGLYDDDYTNNAPGTKLGECATTLLSGLGASTTTTCTLLTPVNVTAGNYWVYLRCETGTVDIYWTLTGGIHTTSTVAYTVPANLNNSTIGAWAANLYASGTAAGPPGGGVGGGRGRGGPPGLIGPGPTPPSGPPGRGGGPGRGLGIGGGFHDPK